jgi:fructose-bisphosphate aldolase class I
MTGQSKRPQAIDEQKRVMACAPRSPYTHACRPGQNARLATVHLNAINRLPRPKPWKVSFSYGRALQDPALEAWHGRGENVAASQQALYRRARSNGAASVGKYTDELEMGSPSADDPSHRRDWHDD